MEDAPAVGTPEDGGIVASEFLDAITNSDLSNLIATEIVEFLPRFDDEQKTRQLYLFLFDNDNKLCKKRIYIDEFLQEAGSLDWKFLYSFFFRLIFLT